MGHSEPIAIPNTHINMLHRLTKTNLFSDLLALSSFVVSIALLAKGKHRQSEYLQVHIATRNEYKEQYPLGTLPEDCSMISIPMHK